MGIFDEYLDESFWNEYVYEGEYTDLDENNHIVPVDESVTEVLSGIVGAAISIAVLYFNIKDAKQKNEIKAALKSYELNNDDLIPLQDFDKKLYKLSFWTKDVTDKEDKGWAILGKLLGKQLYDKMRRNKANRFVEYTKDGKFQIGVLFSQESHSALGVDFKSKSCAVSFSKSSSANVLKHKEYYINKILIEHEMCAKDYKKFVEKMDNNNNHGNY